MNKKMKSVAIGMTLVLGMGALTGCSGGDSSQQAGKDSNQKVELEFLSTKSESKETLEKLIAKFEEQNPNIDITLNTPPDAETVLRARLAKNDLPDLLGIGGNATYAELAQAGILKNFEETSLVDRVQGTYIDMIGQLVGEDIEGVYGIPYVTNANGIIYNVDKFNEAGYEIPKTWDELIAICEDIKEKGETAFYFGYKDAWTAKIPWNALGANLVEADFATRKSNGETTFKEEYREVAEKILKLAEYSNEDILGKSYSDANTAVAQGESYMYLQGNWAIAEILKLNPEVNLGMFAFPSMDGDTKLISGVDVLLTATEASEHPEEAQKFIEFMLEQENAQQYIDEQAAFSAVQGVVQNDSTVADVAEYISEDKLLSFPDHYYLPGFPFENPLQQLFIDQDVDQLLETLDNEWDLTAQ